MLYDEQAVRDGKRGFYLGAGDRLNSAARGAELAPVSAFSDRILSEC